MHINKKDLIEFDNGNMNTQEVIEFLSHLDHCDFCLDQMMEQEDSSTDTAPSYLMEQILDKADSGEVQLARAANKASRKIRLLHYSLQTAAGVMVALLLLFNTNSPWALITLALSIILNTIGLSALMVRSVRDGADDD